jgi:hypothetical protein
LVVTFISSRGRSGANVYALDEIPHDSARHNLVSVAPRRATDREAFARTRIERTSLALSRLIPTRQLPFVAAADTECSRRGLGVKVLGHLVKKPSDLTTDEKTVAHVVPLPISVQRTKKAPKLEQIRGPGAPRDFVLDLQEVVVGRSLQANISIEGGGVSRQHLALRRSDGEYTCTDLDSANGMFLNGIKTHSAVLREGDTIQMGDVVFVFHEGS